ncbi:MAG: lysylphosphatidylglycerol synthase domain-containing protein, partial [Ilumatobacteraceae bacterium]
MLVAGAAFVLLGWAASTRPDSDVRLAEFFAGWPSWARTLAWAGYTAAAIAALALVVAAVASRVVRRDVVRDLLCGLAIAAVLAVVSARAATGAWPFVLPEVIDPPDELPYPTARPALVLIVTLVLGVYVNAGAQRLMRWMAGAVTVAPLILGLSTLTGVFGALALSLFSVVTVRLAFGSPEGLPSLDQLVRSLGRSGISLHDAAYRDEQPGTVGLATATAADGRAVDGKVYGRDAASRQRAERVWRALWYRRAGPSPRAGRSEQAQHEALAVLSAGASGINVPPLLGAGQDDDGDVVIVAAAPSGSPLARLTDPTDAQLTALWRELRDLHEQARITHGSVRPDTVLVDGGRGELVDLSAASLMPTEQQLATDVVSMLASQSIPAGVERAVDAAIRIVEPAVLESALPYAQAAVLDPSLGRNLRSAGHDMEAIAEHLADRLEVEAPDPAPVRRVSWSDVFVAVAAIIAANALIGQIADVGFDTLIDELREATLGWLVVAFVMNLLTYGTAYFALKAVVERPLPLLPLSLLQSAKSFVGLVVPSMVGRVGLDIRFLQVSGVPLVTASTQGPVIGFVGFIAEASLLALSAWAIGQELDIDGLGDFDGGGLVALAIAVVVVGIIIVLAVPKLRNAVLPVVVEALGSVRSIVTSPAKLATVYASEMADRLLKALALGATVAAFGADLPFPALIFVS